MRSYLSAKCYFLVRNFLPLSQITDAETELSFSFHQKVCVFGSHPTLPFNFLSELGNMVFQLDLLNFTLNCAYFQLLLIYRLKLQETIPDVTIFIKNDREMMAQLSAENVFLQQEKNNFSDFSSDVPKSDLNIR